MAPYARTRGTASLQLEAGQGRGVNRTVNESDELFLGVDAGTSGVRAAVVSQCGEVLAQASAPIAEAAVRTEPDRHEQQPEAWWDAAREAIAATLAKLQRNGVRTERLAALAIDGTSGTIVPAGRAGEALAPALMYDDARAAEQAEVLNDTARGFCQKLGYRFSSSFGLAKLLWIKDHQPALFERAARFLHHADYLQERLTGQPAVTDWSNALKTGYDLIGQCWPEWLDRLLPVAEKLPRVVAPGTPVGRVRARAAAETGLSEGLTVVAGATDGTAAFLASGVRRPGDWNTTLGSTLVFKGLSTHICRHPQGLIYCHRLPGGWWLPGAAANTGAQWIEALFPGSEPSLLDAAAGEHLPTDQLAWPLVGRGERFPFLCPQAEGLLPRDDRSASERYAACLAGVGLFERLCYQVLDQSVGQPAGASSPDAHEQHSRAMQAEGADARPEGADTRPEPAAAPPGEVYTTGGASRSDVWAQVRADATGRVFHRPACPQSFLGATVLAACGIMGRGLDEVVGRMVRIERSFVPEAAARPRYEELFQRFCEELTRRGCL